MLLPDDEVKITAMGTIIDNRRRSTTATAIAAKIVNRTFVTRVECTTPSLSELGSSCETRSYM